MYIYTYSHMQTYERILFWFLKEKICTLSPFHAPPPSSSHQSYSHVCDLRCYAMGTVYIHLYMLTSIGKTGGMWCVAGLFIRCISYAGQTINSSNLVLRNTWK